jgi:hypothetical protein
MFNTLTPKPSQLFGALSALILMTAFSSAQRAGQGGATRVFKSAHVVSATDVPYPAQSIAIGTVELEVTVSERAQGRKCPAGSGNRLADGSRHRFRKELALHFCVVGRKTDTISHDSRGHLQSSRHSGGECPVAAVLSQGTVAR